MSRRPARSTVWTKVFFALLFVPMFAVFPYLATVNNPNENVRVYMTMALVDEHTFTIDREVSVFGWTNDMAKVPQPDGGSKYFSVKAPANSFLGVPAYSLFRVGAQALGHRRPTELSPPAERAWWLRNATWWLRILSVQLPCYLFLILFEGWLRAHVRREDVRLSAVAALGLGSAYFGYALMFVSHALEGVAMFGAFALVEGELRRTGNRPKKADPAVAFGAGLLVGGTVLLEYHALPTAAVLALFAAYVFRSPKLLVAFGLGAAIDVAAMMWFQHCAYGDAFTPGHRMVEDPALQEWHKRGLFGIALPDGEKLGLLAMSPTYGFFGTSPFMYLGLFAAPLALVGRLRGAQSGPRAVLASATWIVGMIVLWLVVSAAAPWRGGWTLGPRLLGGASPFFAYSGALLVDRFARRGPRTAAVVVGGAVGLALASVLSIGFPALVYNSLPETVERPLLHFAIPLARAGFVAHHVFEWVGLEGTRPWLFPAVAMLLVPLVALLAFPKRARGGWLVVPALAVVLAIGMRPALAPGKLEDGHKIGLDWFAKIWEPQGRDRLARLAASNDPCRFQKSAEVYDALSLHAEAEAQRALQATIGACR